MLKREWGAESNGKLPYLFIPSKTATYVPELAMDELPLGRIAALVPDIAVKDLPLGRTLVFCLLVRGSQHRRHRMFLTCHISENFGNVVILVKSW